MESSEPETLIPRHSSFLRPVGANDPMHVKCQLGVCCKALRCKARAHARLRKGNRLAPCQSLDAAPCLRCLHSATPGPPRCPDHDSGWVWGGLLADMQDRMARRSAEPAGGAPKGFEPGPRAVCVCGSPRLGTWAVGACGLCAPSVGCGNFG